MRRTARTWAASGLARSLELRQRTLPLFFPENGDCPFAGPCATPRDCPRFRRRSSEGLSPCFPGSCPKPQGSHRANRAQSRLRSPSANHIDSPRASRHHDRLASRPARQTATRSANRPASLLPNKPASHAPSHRQIPPANRGQKDVRTGLPNYLLNRPGNGSQGDSRGVVFSHLQIDGLANVL